MASKYERFIGQLITLKGFNPENHRQAKIVRVYYLGGIKKFPAFECVIIGNYLKFQDGDRENLLCRDAIINGVLKKEMFLLTA